MVTRNYKKVILIDFDCVARVGQSQDQSIKSVNRISRYSSPEQVDQQISTKNDIWSFGCLLIFLLTGLHPYHGDEEVQFVRKLKKKVCPLTNLLS